jgi:hypothetical protein
MADIDMAEPEPALASNIKTVEPAPALVADVDMAEPVPAIVADTYYVPYGGFMRKPPPAYNVADFGIDFNMELDMDLPALPLLTGKKKDEWLQHRFGVNSDGVSSDGVSGDGVSGGGVSGVSGGGVGGEYAAAAAAAADKPRFKVQRRVPVRSQCSWGESNFSLRVLFDDHWRASTALAAMDRPASPPPPPFVKFYSPIEMSEDAIKAALDEMKTPPRESVGFANNNKGEADYDSDADDDKSWASHQNKRAMKAAAKEDDDGTK